MVTTIRTVRSERSVPPSRKITAIIDEADEHARAMLQRYAPYLRQLAGLEALEFRGDVAPDVDTVKRVLEHAHVFVPLAGIVDHEAEIEKLRKELAGLAREAESIARKLGTASFVERAPASVVQEVQSRAVQITERQQKLEAQLTELGA